MSGSAAEGSDTHLAPLADYRFLLAAALLLLNDSVLKTRWPGLVTGKLSDFVGPVVLATIIAVVLGRRTQAVQAAVAVVAVFMAAIKLSTPAATAVASVLGTLTGSDTQIIADPTDLVGLVALAIVGSIVTSPRPLMDRRLARFAALAFALYATVATSAVAIESQNQVGMVDGEIFAYDSSHDGFHSALVLSDGEWIRRSIPEGEVPQGGQVTPYCLEADQSICVKADGAFRVLESADGGDTWVRAFDIGRNEGWLSSSDVDVMSGSSEGPGEVLELDDGTLIVSMGEIEPIIRSPLGTWSPTDIEARVFPFLEWLMLAATVFAFVNAVLLILRARGRAKLIAPGVLIPLLTIPWLLGAAWFWVGGESRDLVTGFLLVGGVIGWPFVAIACIVAWVETHRTEERGQAIIGLSAVSSIGAAILTCVPLVLWKLGVLNWSVTRVGSIVVACLLSLGAVALVLAQKSESKPKAPPAAPAQQFGGPGVDASQLGL